MESDPAQDSEKPISSSNDSFDRDENSKPIDSNQTRDYSKPSSNEVSLPQDTEIIEHKPQSKSRKFLFWLNRTSAIIAPLLAVCLCSVTIHFLPLYFSGWNNKILTPLKTLNHQTTELIDEMQKTFPFQKDETWISLLAALNSVIEERPSQPAVLLFIGRDTPAAIRTMQHVATTLAININELLHTTNSVNANFQGVTVQVDKITDLIQQDDVIKQELDEKIRSILSKSFSVVIGPLEKIPPKAAMLLHGYCDNFMAPFKKSVIILTAIFDYDMPRNSKAVERKLHSLWDPILGVDKSASIVSRVANNVVFIELETDSI